MQKTQQELIDIADKMLAQLENDYWQTQQCNLASQVECPEEEVAHQDYHILGGDDDEPDQMSDDEEEGEEREENQINKNQIAVEATQLQEEGKQIVVQVEQSKANEEIGELVQIFPTEEWKAPQKQININSQKIKQLTLNMNLPVPEWMKDEVMLKNRITQLFGQKKTK